MLIPKEKPTYDEANAFLNVWASKYFEDTARMRFVADELADLSRWQITEWDLI